MPLLMSESEDFLDIFEGLREVARFDVEHVCDVLRLTGLTDLFQCREDTARQNSRSGQAALLAIRRQSNIVFLAEIEDAGIEPLIRRGDLKGLKHMEEITLLVGEHIPGVVAADFVHGPASIR